VNKIHGNQKLYIFQVLQYHGLQVSVEV